MQCRQLELVDYNYDQARVLTGESVEAWEAEQLEAGSVRSRELRPGEQWLVMAGEGCLEGLPWERYRPGTLVCASELTYFRVRAERASQFRRGYAVQALQDEFARRQAAVTPAGLRGRFVEISDCPEPICRLFRGVPGELATELDRLGLEYGETNLQDLSRYCLGSQGPLGPQRRWVEFLMQLPGLAQENLVLSTPRRRWWGGSGWRHWRWCSDPRGLGLERELKRLQGPLTPVPALEERHLRLSERVLAHWREQGVWRACDQALCLVLRLNQRRLFPARFRHIHNLASARAGTWPIPGDCSLYIDWHCGRQATYRFQAGFLAEEWSLSWSEHGSVEQAELLQVSD